MLALFRLYEPLPGSQIVIDGADISKVHLTTLRRGLGIIPQEPIIFSGTLRYNLDPFSTASDQELWAALEKTQLKDVASQFSEGLDTEISGSGQTRISHGQCQLVCIARALLRNCHILLCDEATSSVDPETDQVIQKILRSEFKSCTVLTIAHRLGTIIDSDRILVLEDGRVVELDTPQHLMADPSSKFAAMIRTYGLGVAGAADVDLNETSSGPQVRELQL